MSALIPVNISFQEWCNQLRNSYPTQDIPHIVSSEKEWKKFPDMLQSNRCFNNYFLPDVVGYTDWRQWASQFLLSIGA